MSIPYTNNPLLPDGVIMPNTPVENIPDGFTFVRIQSSRESFARVWLKCEADGHEYPFQCDWKSEDKESLIVGQIEEGEIIGDWARAYAKIDTEMMRLQLRELKRDERDRNYRAEFTPVIPDINKPATKHEIIAIIVTIAIFTVIIGATLLRNLP
jgi:hypothetical protein